MIFWVILVGILLYTVMLGPNKLTSEAYTSNQSTSPMYRNPSAFRYSFGGYSNYHKYPFDFHSLYGLDELPSYEDLAKLEAVKTIQRQTEWDRDIERRRDGKDYIGLPSYNHVRQFGEVV